MKIMPETKTGQALNIERAEKMLITPQMAEQWLKRNENNRSVSWSAVEKIAEDIRTGLWMVNGETIIIDKKGSIVDGQHRLLACEMAEKSITSWVVLGVEPKTRDTVDAGRVRTHGDRFKMRSESYPNHLAAAINAINAVVYNRKQRSFSQVERQARLEYRAAKEIILPAVINDPLLRSAPVLGALFYAYAADPQKVTSFVERLSSGADLPAADAALTLRNYLAWHAHGRSNKHTRAVIFHKTLRAAEAALAGKKLPKLAANKSTVDFFKSFHEDEANKLTAATEPALPAEKVA